MGIAIAEEWSAHIAIAMKRTSSACSTGDTDDARPETMFFRPLNRRKMRINRNARRERMTLTGILNGPSAISEIVTTTTSKMFQPSEMKSLNQWAKMLIQSSMANTTVKMSSMVSSPGDVLETWDSAAFIIKFCLQSQTHISERSS